MDCNDAIGVLAVVAILATIATVVITTTSVLLLWKPHLFPARLALSRRGKKRNSAAESGTKNLEQDLERLSSITNTATTSTIQLTTIEETDEPLYPPSLSLEKTDLAGESYNGSGLKGEKEGEGKGDGEERESVPTTPMSPESGDTRVRKRSRVSLSSLAGSISSKLGVLHPRRVSSGGGGGGHTPEEVVDLMREREERSSSPSSREDELECRDSIFIQSLDDVAVPHALLEGRPTAGDDCFVLDLHFNQGESVV